MGYTTVQLGLTLTIPTSGTRNWGQQLLVGTWNKISSHDHSGGGLGNQIDAAGLSDESVNSDKLAKNIGLTQATVITVTGADNTVTIDFDNGNIQFVDLTGATGFLTIQFAHPQPGANYQIFIKQPATALDPINWPAAVKWPQGQELIPTAELNAVDAVSLYYDGTGAVYYGDWQLNFS